MTPHPSARRSCLRGERLRRTRDLVAVVLAVTAFCFGMLGTAPTPVAASGSAPEGRTWVVDAVDDAYGNYWEAEATGTPQVTVEVGDTVEWRFDRAAIEHDLTSVDTASVWDLPVAEYRVPGDEPFRYRFSEPGTYDFVCSIHGTLMRGTVVVTEPGTNQPPTVEASADPLTGPAPLSVHFASEASDPDGDPLTHRWDFGTVADPEDPSDQSTSDHGHHVYAEPGTYPATLEVSDGRGGTVRREFTVVVTDGDGPGPEPEPETGLPAIEALAEPAAGTAPLTVALSTRVTTVGDVLPFADGAATYPELAGTATLVRERDRSRARLDADGLAPDAAHLVHVHEQACADGNGGAHFRFDETQAFGEQNELWLPFTSDATGASGRVEVVQPLRAGPRAVSVVVHDPDNPAQRIGCADLAPGTADLTYAWDFGDGATGTGPDPEHRYQRAGTYRATVTVSRPSATGHGVAHAGHEPEPSVSASVDVVVGGDDTVAPRTSLLRGPRGIIRTDRAGFHLGATEPGTFECRLDAAPWRPCVTRPVFTRLAEGAHRLQARAVDVAGNRDATPVTRHWRTDTRRPVVRLLSPRGRTPDRTPTLRARLLDAGSAVRARSVVLRLDGRRVAARYSASSGRLRFVPRRALRPGRHQAAVTATDLAGHRVVVRWRFVVRR